MSDLYRNKCGASRGWYGLAFLAVMASCALLVFLLQRLGFAGDYLWMAVLGATLFHTGMSMEGLYHFSVGTVDSMDDKAMRRKLELFTGAFGGLVDIVLLSLILYAWQWLDTGPVLTIIFFITAFILPPALGIAAGFHLAKRIVCRR